MCLTSNASLLQAHIHEEDEVGYLPTVRIKMTLELVKILTVKFFSYI